MSSTINGLPLYFGALAAMNTARQELLVAGKRLQTGYRVADAADDAGVFAVAQGMRGEIESLSRIVSINIAANAAVGIARQGVEAISDILVQLEKKVIELRANSQSTANSIQLQNEFNGFLQQIDRIALGAKIQGVGLLSQDDPLAPAVFVPDGGTQTITTTGIPTIATPLSPAFTATGPASYSFTAPAFDPTASNPRIEIVGSALIDPNGFSLSFSGNTYTANLNGPFSISLGDTGGSRDVTLDVSDIGLPANGFTIDAVRYVVDNPPAVTSSVTQPTGSWVNNPEQGSFRVINDTSGTSTVVRYVNMTSAGLGFTGTIYSPLDNLRQALADAKSKTSAMLQYFASKQREIEGVIAYTTQKIDATAMGLGAIADSDIGREQAMHEAAKAKERLGIEGFSIANATQQAVLGYLRDVRVLR